MFEGLKVGRFVGVMGLVLAACANATPTPSTPSAGQAKAPSTPTAASATPVPTVPVTIVAPLSTVASTIENPKSEIVNTPVPQPTVTFSQLTTGECCVQPFLSPDGERVLFIDKPSADAPTGVWAVGVNASSTPGQPQLFSENLGPFSRNLAFAVNLDAGGRTVIRQLGDGATFNINNGGRPVSFSPDTTRIAWTVQDEVGGFDVRRSQLWIANIDGTDARQVATRIGGGVLAWLPDSRSMLIGGKANRADQTATLSILRLDDGSVRDLIPIERLRSGVLSPDGRWLMYFVGQARDSSLDGTYLLDLNAASPQPQRMDFFGAYRWRDATRVLYIPLDPGAPSNELWQLDVTTMEQTRLIAADATSPFKIANGDWDVARDGSKLIFLSARDRNIWLATLP